MSDEKNIPVGRGVSVRSSRWINDLFLLGVFATANLLNRPRRLLQVYCNT